MNKIKAFILSYSFKLIIRLFIYLIFLIYGIYNVATIKNPISITVVIGVTLLFLIVVIYYEYLKYLYRKAIISLNDDCDLSEALKNYDLLQKYDYLKGFEKERIVFDCLINLTTFNTDKVIKMVGENPKIFKANPDQLLLGNGLLFLAYAYGFQKSKAEKAYFEINKLKGVKKITPIYNLNVIDGIYHYMANDYKKALQAFSKVNTTYMNNRECAEYYYFYSLLAKDLKKTELYELNKSKLQTCASKLNFIKRI